MRLLFLLLPVYMFGLGLFCGLTQVTAVKPFQIRPYENSFNDRTPLSPLELARGRWVIDKSWDRNALIIFSHTLQREGLGLGMTPEQLIRQRMANLGSYATFFQNDYIRYFRQRHGNRPTNPPQIVPTALLAEFDSVVDRAVSAKASSDMLMNFVNNHFPHQTSVELNNRILQDRKAHVNFSPGLLEEVGHDAFAKYYLPKLVIPHQTHDAALSNDIFKSFEVLVFLTDEDRHPDSQFVYYALKQAVEPYSDAASSSRQ